MIKRLPTSDRDHHKRKLVRVLAFDHAECYQPTFHYDCPENQVRSLVNRVAGVVPHPTKLGIQMLYRARDAFVRRLPRATQAPLEDMPERYSGAKRERYRNALADLYNFGLERSHSAIKFFVKVERFNPLAKVDPDPRAIQFRGPRYAVLLASYLQPIEHQLYTASYASRGVVPTRNIAKGLNSVDRAKLLLRKLSYFNRPAVLSLDASRFDKHVSVELLRVEHSVYLACNPAREFMTLLSWQLKNRGYSNMGLKYVLRGRRMSGDMNTAVGNCVLMVIMLIAYADHLKLSKWDCLDDGDDCCLIVEREDVDRITSSVFDLFLNFGMEMKIDGISYSMPEVVFCRSNPIEFAPGRWKFVRHYADVLSKACTGVRQWDSDKYRLRVLKSIGLCELILNLGIPVLQSFALAILRNVDVRECNLALAPVGLNLRAKLELKTIGVPLEDLRPQVVSMCARESFEQAFGVPIQEQIRMERRLDRIALDFRGSSPLEYELHNAWQWIQTYGEVHSL